jgi:small subunit ribosomal protein S6e
MAEFKLVISDPKKGKSIQKELKDNNARALVGKKIGDVIKGESIDFSGYEFQITGGSDASGFPMRKDVEGSARKRITAVKGVGVKNKLRKPNPKKKGWRTIRGMRLKKNVAGNTVHEKTAQINVKIIKEGREPLFEEKPAENKETKEVQDKKE